MKLTTLITTIYKEYNYIHSVMRHEKLYLKIDQTVGYLRGCYDDDITMYVQQPIVVWIVQIWK